MYFYITVNDQIYIKENVYDENNNRKNIEEIFSSRFKPLFELISM